ncbi:MAG: response regulator [Streptosporangiales bacterium]|nr:response regulator [Streptosporangiales bacterium]
MRGDSPGLVLVVEHQPQVADLERLYLAREGFPVHVEHRGQAGLAAARSLDPVLVVIDVGLPDLDGIEVYRNLRAGGAGTPVLFVAANKDEAAQVRSLGFGRDAYLVKPFSPRELVAKAATSVRQASARYVPAPASTYRVGAVTLDAEARRVAVGGYEISLTATEFELLAYLMRHSGRVYTRDQLLSAVWGPVTTASTRTVDVHVAQLRAKLGQPSPIRTVRGVGYALDG